ncbi:mRNA export factor Mex67p [[Candida] railenensis]|uniref:mRNA export factor Mex67p n=1 Tax=[Candida] railenensis TaxID=45579 RepID=A0A9P0QKU7_9ASCO|nr:mRNA export factor Mex67p [[Candida] railenensis]
MSYRGRGRGGFQNNNNNRNNFNNNNNNNGVQSEIDQFNMANAIPVEILGWNGASMDDCVKFISRKCRITVSNAQVDPVSGVLKGYVRSMKEADELCTWSGVKFAGQSLKISKAISQNSLSNLGSISTPANGGGSTIETITNFLKSRYDPNSKLLNISSVQHDPLLVQQGFFASISTTSKFFPALMKIAADLKLDVESVDLSSNNLTDLTSVSSLAQTFPYLKNLALSQNNFNRIKSFEVWKHKLNYLRELVLINNPIITNLKSAQDLQIVTLEMMRNFPRLIVFNGEVVRDEAKLMAHLTFPFTPMQAMFFQDEMIQQVSTNFVTNFYSLWDGNRQDLMVLYQQESQFSMSVDSSHPHVIEVSTTSTNSNNRAYGGGNTSTDSPFGYYLNQSRNLTRVSNTKSRMSKLAQGQQDIFKQFQQLPRTRHNLLTQPELFSMESHSFPQLNGILITLHGSFEEIDAPVEIATVPSNNPSYNSNNRRFGNSTYKNNNKKFPLGKKSFDRTFVIISGQDGSMIVASDILMVRLFADGDAWNTTIGTGSPAGGGATATNVNVSSLNTPQGTSNVLAQPAGTAELPLDVKAKLNENQQQILVRILLETKLNLQYGIMLCEQSQWDYQQCINNFKVSVNSLPREAYVL